MKTWPSPQLLLLGALAMFALGGGLLYAGLLRAGPAALLAAVLLCVLAAISVTVGDIERLSATTRSATPPAAAEPLQPEVQRHD